MPSANDRLSVAVMGVNGRGTALARVFARTPNVDVAAACDVDDRAVAKCVRAVEEASGKAPAGESDFRRVLERPDVDALVVAAPDFWHAPAAILAMQAGKHVYLEKPGSHNAAEGKLLAAARRKYNRVVQLGTQRRSDPHWIEAVLRVHAGLIGDVYYAKAWYANTRGPIGHGKQAPVPDWLDYELWQGPVPRRPFRDNLVHYNWHWFRRYGTGEAGNNASHHLDICRWALDVDYPVHVTSAGGRFHYDDDWEFFDTQVMSFEFEGGKAIAWEGRSCNGMPIGEDGHGVTLHGTGGTVHLTDEAYTVLDPSGSVVERRPRDEGPGSTDRHVLNFCDAVRLSEPLHQPVEEGQKSILLCHLGNIAQAAGRALRCNPLDGSILDDSSAMQHWSRTYEPGWAPVV